MLKLLPILALVGIVLVSGCTTDSGPDIGTGEDQELTEDEAFNTLEDELDSLDEGSDDLEDELLNLLEQ